MSIKEDVYDSLIARFFGDNEYNIKLAKAVNIYSKKWMSTETAKARTEDQILLQKRLMKIDTNSSMNKFVEMNGYGIFDRLITCINRSVMYAVDDIDELKETIAEDTFKINEEIFDDFNHIVEIRRFRDTESNFGYEFFNYMKDNNFKSKSLSISVDRMLSESNLTLEGIKIKVRAELRKAKLLGREADTDNILNIFHCVLHPSPTRDLRLIAIRVLEVNTGDIV